MLKWKVPLKYFFFCFRTASLDGSRFLVEGGREGLSFGMKNLYKNVENKMEKKIIVVRKKKEPPSKRDIKAAEFFVFL